MSGKITRLVRQKRRRNRVSIFLDGEYSFSLQDILAAELHVGQELTEKEIAVLQQRDAAESAYDNALHYLSYRPRSEKEMERYLQRKGLESQDIERVLARLRRANLIDDREFAEFWVENREAHRPRGRWALRAELRQKGVGSDAIEAALEDLDEESGAFRAAERRVRRYSHLDEQTFRRRMLGFLQRRGFGYAICRRVTDRLWDQVKAEREPDPD